MNETTSQAQAIIEKWHQALNKKDKELLVALVTANVKVGGPKGAMEGVMAMLDWVNRAHITLIPQKYFSLGNTYLVEETARWHHPDTQEIVGSQAVVSVFIMENNLIAQINRYDNLNQALAALGLSAEDLKIWPKSDPGNL